jgi:hypothetical protein
MASSFIVARQPSSLPRSSRRWARSTACSSSRSSRARCASVRRSASGGATSTSPACAYVCRGRRRRRARRGSSTCPSGSCRRSTRPARSRTARPSARSSRGSPRHPPTAQGLPGRGDGPFPPARPPPSADHDLAPGGRPRAGARRAGRARSTVDEPRRLLPRHARRRGRKGAISVPYRRLICCPRGVWVVSRGVMRAAKPHERSGVGLVRVVLHRSERSGSLGFIPFVSAFRP